jgi:hypothetical protein
MSSEIAEKAAELFHQYLTQQVAAAALNHERITAILAAWPARKELVERPGGKLPSPCQALVEALFEEASAFRGAVPQESRRAWLKSIEACKAKIPDSEYNQALAILRAGS